MSNSTPPNSSNRRESHRVGFVLLPGFSLLAAASAIEVLQATNALLDARVFEVLLISMDGEAVAASGGQSLNVGASVERCGELTSAFIVAEAMPAPTQAQIHSLAQMGTSILKGRGVLGGIGTGAAWWAHLGLMAGYRCVIPSAHAASLMLSAPDVRVSANLYEIDRNRLSCVGSHSSLDLMISWLGERMGERFLRSLLAHFSLAGTREPQAPNTPAAVHPGTPNKFAEAVALMQSNLSEPLSTEDIAGLVGVSRRQLERLFKQHLDTLPSRWYLEQRLALAQRLLKESSQSILQVGLSCGFTSAAHFSNAYRNHFGRTPRDERSARANAWRNGLPTRTDPLIAHLEPANGAGFDAYLDLKKDQL